MKKGVDAKSDFDAAKSINTRARDVFNEAASSLERCRDKVQAKLEELGRQKVMLYQEAFPPFVDVFSRIKNVDFDDSGIPVESLEDIEVDILEIREISVQMSEAIGGGAGTLGAGALAGLATYGSVGLLGTASTGTAIGTLSGAAATNATLAWLGGGSLATGGMGMAGGKVVLGGIVAAPVLLVGGLLLASKAEEAKENARSNLAKAEAAAEAMQNAEIAARSIGRMADQTRSVLQDLCGHLSKDTAALQRIVRGNDDYRTYAAVRRVLQNLCGHLSKGMAALQHMMRGDDDYRTYDAGEKTVVLRAASVAVRRMLQNLCGHLSKGMAALQRIVRGNDDYRTYDAGEKAVVLRAAAVAVTLKNIAKTPLLEEDGSVTDAIRDTVRKAKKFIEQLEAM